MNFIEELKWRGQIQDQSPGLEAELSKGSIKAYVGFDPTAPSLTIGNLVSAMLLKHLQRAGHTPIVLLGGATGKIGDPSGKDQERQLLDYTVLQRNINRMAEQFKKILDYDGPNAVIVVDNADFYKGMDVFTFLRDIGKNVTVNYMLSKDSVKSRIGEGTSGMSFTEFSYQLIQGYDFQYLYQNENCILQMGGSDQWGNITTGTHFVGKNGGKAYGLTCPLLTKSDGKKFGKSEKGNIWLDPGRTTPFQFYQFWLNSADADIPRLLKTFSLKSRAEIEALIEQAETDPNSVKKVLGEEVTRMIHSDEAFEAALKATEIVFSKKLKKEFVESLTETDLEMLAGELHLSQASRAEVIEDKKTASKESLGKLMDNGGIAVADLLAGRHHSLDSKSKVFNAIKGNAIAINAIKVSDKAATIKTADLLHGKYLFLQNGKKNKFLVVIED